MNINLINLLLTNLLAFELLHYFSYKTSVELNQKIYILLIGYSSKMEWTDRKNLDKVTIEIILKGSNEFKKLGKAYPSDEVPYPVLGVDVVDALYHIIEENLVGAFVGSLKDCKGEVLLVDHIEYQIPIKKDRMIYERETPNIFFSLSLKDDSTIEGKLYNTYDGNHTIINFLEIPRDNIPAKV